MRKKANTLLPRKLGFLVDRQQSLAHRKSKMEQGICTAKERRRYVRRSLNNTDKH